jgi:hypothetical protein
MRKLTRNSRVLRFFEPRVVAVSTKNPVDTGVDVRFSLDASGWDVVTPGHWRLFNSNADFIWLNDQDEITKFHAYRWGEENGYCTIIPGFRFRSYDGEYSFGTHLEKLLSDAGMVKVGDRYVDPKTDRSFSERTMGSRVKNFKMVEITAKLRDEASRFFELTTFSDSEVMIAYWALNYEDFDGCVWSSEDDQDSDPDCGILFAHRLKHWKSVPFGSLLHEAPATVFVDQARRITLDKPNNGTQWIEKAVADIAVETIDTMSLVDKLPERHLLSSGIDIDACYDRTLHWTSILRLGVVVREAQQPNSIELNAAWIQGYDRLLDFIDKLSKAEIDILKKMDNEQRRDLGFVLRTTASFDEACKNALEVLRAMNPETADFGP